jgi:hypothetical protein
MYNGSKSGTFGRWCLTWLSGFEFQAKIVAEAANGPVTPLAETILEDNDVVILPDLLLNAVSFFVPTLLKITLLYFTLFLPPKW